MNDTSWKLNETEFVPQNTRVQESLFTLGNGFIGIRGNLDEGGPAGYSLEGNYINGFCETAPIHYEERKEGYAAHSETMLNLTAAKTFLLTLEDEPFDLAEGIIIKHSRELDMAEGVLKRYTRWRSPEGREAEITSTRLVSLVEKNIIAIKYEVTPFFGGRITIKTGIDGDVKNVTRVDDTRVGTNLVGRSLERVRIEVGKNSASLVQKTKLTDRMVACGMKVIMEQDERQAKTRAEVAEDTYLLTKIADLEPGETFTVTKFIAYACGEEAEDAMDIAEAAAEKGFDFYTAAQREFLRGFWRDADIVIEGQPELQRSVRFGIFSLLQAAGRDGRSSIAAKGLSGEGYQGHYFWETETYMLPVFIFTHPEIAKALLLYRYNILNSAKKLAAEHALKGAMYPWRTIGGTESSSYYPAGTAQYHVTGGVSYAVKLYYEATVDEEFLMDCGAEILFETARMWYSLGHFNRRSGKFCIDSVTGPDEYTTVVNNNCYTNITAAENLLFAAEVFDLLTKTAPEKLQAIARKINLYLHEPADWRNAGEDIFLPYDDERKIYMQDDSFLDKKPWDFDAYRNIHLMHHFHPLQIYRAQVCKQADLILAELLFPHRFDKAQITRDYEYYEPITSHDSSLSECVYGMVAARIGKTREALDFFMGSAFMDINNTHQNTGDGLHMANMAGNWLCIIYGFAGFWLHEKKARFAPYLPEGWARYSFCLRLEDGRLKVEVTAGQTLYTLEEGESLSFVHHGEEVELSAESRCFSGANQ